jgi:hydroxymethylbilane synthase
MLRVGTRGSKLALAQTNEVVNKLEALGIKCEVIQIKTTGDIITDKPLVDIGGKALFLKEIEDSLIAQKIHIAVHSLKDVPAILPDGLIIPAVLPRLPPEDLLIAHQSLQDLPYGATIGTCASRRKAFLQYHFKNKFKFIDLRGNIDTRIDKFNRGDLDGVILAKSGVQRLQLQKYIAQVIPSDIILPAIGQGVIAIECREDNDSIVELLEQINHEPTYDCIKAERGFMIEMGGNCKTPMAALATINGSVLQLKAAFAVPDGSDIFIDEVIGNKCEAHDLGVKVAQQIKNRMMKSQYFELVRDLFKVE